MKLVDKYIQKHAADAQLNLKQFSVSEDVEAIHHLRVSLKKLRAVIKVIDALQSSHRFKKKQKANYKMLFTDSGEIRLIQLISKWLILNKFEVLLQYSASKKQLPQRILLFNEHVAKYDHLISSVAKKLSLLSGDLKEQQLLSYAVSIKETIMQLRANANTDNWHELRKQIKQLLYLCNMLSASSRLKMLHVAQFKVYDLLQENIGAWHDLEDFKSWLIQEGFFMSKDEELQNAFRKAWKKINLQLEAAEKKVQSSLRQKTKLNTGINK